jgi:hypothetical protein
MKRFAGRDEEDLLKQFEGITARDIDWIDSGR